MGILRGLISVYILLVFAHALRSWVNLGLGVTADYWLNRLVEPALRPIRALLAPLQRNLGVDFSPADLIVILVAFQRLL